MSDSVDARMGLTIMVPMPRDRATGEPADRADWRREVVEAALGGVRAWCVGAHLFIDPTIEVNDGQEEKKMANDPVPQGHAPELPERFLRYDDALVAGDEVRWASTEPGMGQGVVRENAPAGVRDAVVVFAGGIVQRELSVVDKTHLVLERSVSGSSSGGAGG